MCSFTVLANLEPASLSVHTVSHIVVSSFMDKPMTLDYFIVMFSQRISATAATNILRKGSFVQVYC